MTAANDGELIRAIVHLQPRVEIQGGAATTGAARAELVSKLKASAHQTQAPLLSYLEKQRTAGGVVAYQPFWITNAIAVRARPAAIRELARHPSVATVRLDRWRQWVSGFGGYGNPPYWTTKKGTRGRQAELTPVQATTEAQPDGPIEWNISHIRADEVWHALHISATGAVVASMDTGVDWFHPAVRESYRGHNPHGPPRHVYNWFDATDGKALYPVDGHGHGTHTLGTIVGQGGIGVAPGARWIAIRVLNNQGFGYDSWIHAGFQWILAPGGDPSQTPDVVNCSWANKNAYLTTFQEDLQALRAAGILPIFANGNYGSARGSVGSPASLPEAFAVGAVDEYDEVATFSARGPSPWGETRPHVVAPGVHVRSSMPGGAYGSMQGTSMAAPHVSGVVAMLRSISPTLSIAETTRLITSTAVAVGQQVPNNDAGWGRIDAFAAVAALTQPGFITGTVLEEASPGSDLPRPIAGATVIARSHGGEGRGTDISATDGSYRLALAPGIYDLTATAFGYESTTAWGVRAVTDTETVQELRLAPKPTGRLRLQVTSAANQQPITATIAVLDTPHRAVAHAHTFDLPATTYTVRAHRLGYRVVTATAVITVGETSSVELALPDAPSILLVDSGGWYYKSEIGYFRQTLDDLSYAYDEWSIRDLQEDVPSATDLTPYDVVIWSAPWDAPGYIGAGEALSEYLQDGGRLLLTGQDVGYWDGGGSGYHWSPYYRNYLKVRYADDNAPSRMLVGEDGDILSEQVITIAGSGGADNQDFPDVISIADSDAAAPVLRYEGDGCGGARIGTCLGYRAVYLSFGFEAINERVARRRLMDDALDWLTAPPPGAGLELEPPTQLGIGPPGSRVTHTVRLRHIGESGGTDQVSLTLQDASWPTELSDTSLALSSCTSTTVAITVTIPTTATWDVRDVVTLTARSSLSPTVIVSATFETKAPAPILLVDDDRWYDQQAKYRDAMAEANLAYDVWETSTAGGRHGSAPTAETLQQYPLIVWWTGYDWFAPVTSEERTSLATYLDGGGRLMLSSQDFLYYHHDDPFAQTYLGVLTYTEGTTPTQVVGVSENPVGTALGPWPLEYPAGYQNWSDAVVPGEDVGVAFRDQNGRGAALTRRADGEASLFLAFPFEALPAEERALTLERALGWLSWLGPSTFEAEPASVGWGDPVTYTLALHNDGPEVVTASVSNTLPAEIDVDPGAFVGPGTFDPAERLLTWRGAVGPGETVTFKYRASMPADGTLAGSSVPNAAHISLEDHAIAFERSAWVGLEVPDLSQSVFECAPCAVRPGRSTTCTLILRNTGPVNVELATARIHPPGRFSPETGSAWASQGLARWTGEALSWSGPLTAGGTATLTFQLQMPSEPMRRTLYGVALLDDGAGGIWERPEWVLTKPWSAYLPLVSRSQ